MIRIIGEDFYIKFKFLILRFSYLVTKIIKINQDSENLNCEYRSLMLLKENGHLTQLASEQALIRSLNIFIKLVYYSIVHIIFKFLRR